MTGKSVTRPSLIRNASWAIVWEGSRGHVYRTDVDVRLANGQIAEIASGGTLKAGADDSVLEGRGFLLMPGLVDIHSHPSTEPSFRGLREDHGVPEQYMTGLHERSQAFRLDADGAQGRNRDGLCRDAVLRRHHGGGPVGAVRGLDRRDARVRPAGLRRRRLRAGRWGMSSQAVVTWEWDEAAGAKGFEQAKKILDELDADASGRLKGVVYPLQIDTVTEELFRESFAYAEATAALHEPPGADGGGGARDDPAPRRHAGAMGRQHRHPEPAHHHGALHLPRRPSADRLAYEARPRHPGRDRHDGGALPFAVRTLRRRARLLRPVSNGRASTWRSAPTSPRTT